MTCGSLSGGLELEFLTSGVRIQPIEGTFRDKHREFMVGTFTMSERAGEVIQENAHEAEPVHVKVGGNVAHRLMYEREELSFRRDITRENAAELHLKDALYVFARNTVSFSWDNVSAVTVIDELADRLRDPNEVIKDIKYTTGYHDFSADQFYDVRTEDEPDPIGSVNDLIGDYLPTKLDKFKGSFDFDDENLMDAFFDVINAFGLDAWVSLDGTLFIGNDVSWGEVLEVLDTEDISKLVKYTVTESSSNTKHVAIEGPFTSSKDDFLGYDIPFVEPGVDREKGTHGYAVATRTDIDEGATKTFKAYNVSTLDLLETRAVTELFKSAVEESNGTIEFNGYMLTEKEQATYARVSVGDHIKVDGDIPNSCAHSSVDFIGGEFVIKSVQHRMNSREGWRIILSVGTVPSSDDINSRSFRFTPTKISDLAEDDAWIGSRSRTDIPITNDNG